MATPVLDSLTPDKASYNVGDTPHITVAGHDADGRTIVVGIAVDDAEAHESGTGTVNVVVGDPIHPVVKSVNDPAGVVTMANITISGMVVTLPPV